MSLNKKVFGFYLLFSGLTISGISSATESCILTDKNVLVDTAQSLKEISQDKLIEKSCDELEVYFDEKTGKLKSQFADNNKAKEALVLCGKWRFFNLGMRSAVGVPKKLLESMETYPDGGKRLKNIGFLDDASWANEPYAFGIVPAKHKSRLSIKRVAAGKNVQVSCAGCHVGELPDGRFSVGGANHKLNFGKFNALALYSIWLVDKKKMDPKVWDQSLIDYYKELEKLPKPAMLQGMSLVNALPTNSFVLKYLIGEEAPGLASQKSFLKSKPGVFNGFAPILNFDNREIYVSIPQIWEIGREKPVHYGNLAGIKDLDTFIEEAILITTQISKYSKPKYVVPIREYMKCLETPKNPSKLISVKKVNGKKLFNQSCVSCHNLPDGSSSEAYSFERMGTPVVFKNIFDGYVPTDIQSKKTYRVFRKPGIANIMTDKVRARRLNGIWTRSNLTSNGGVEDLDELFCLKNKSRSIIDPQNPQTSGIHSELCVDFSEPEKLDLKEYLLSL